MESKAKGFQKPAQKLTRLPVKILRNVFRHFYHMDFVTFKGLMVEKYKFTVIADF